MLDAGTGTGYGARILKAAGAAEVRGIDIDSSSINQAREKFQAEGLEYLVDDCEQLANVQGPFDVICNFENIEHLNKPEAFLENAARLLKDDGLLLCSTPDRATSEWEGDRPSNPYHTVEWYRHEFQALLNRSFEEVEIRVQIEYLSVVLRRQAAHHLTSHLAYLWKTPMVRVSRLVDKLFKQQAPSWETLGHLAASSPGDFPIVPHDLAPFLGQSQVHFALCRKPRRG